MFIYSGDKMGVRFKKTKSAGWNGNGFGSTTASWEAIVGDEVVGTYDGSGAGTYSLGTGYINGRRILSITVTDWKKRIRGQYA